MYKVYIYILRNTELTENGNGKLPFVARTQRFYIERLCKRIWKTTFEQNSSFPGPT